MTALATEALTVRFGAFTAVSSVTLAVAPGSRHALSSPARAIVTERIEIDADVPDWVFGDSFAMSRVEIKGAHRVSRLDIYNVAFDQPSTAMPLVDLAATLHLVEDRCRLAVPAMDVAGTSRQF